MNIRHLEYILEIYKSGSLNKTAKKCFISQSYLSKITKTFEDELGFKIINTSNRGVTFTDEGLLFVKSAEIIVQESKNILNIQQTLQKDQSLNITCSPSSILAQTFINFKKISYWTNAYDVLIEGGIQLIFKNMTARFSNLGIAVMFNTKTEKYRHFCECYNLKMDILLDDIPIMAVMSINHPLAMKQQVSLENLRQFPFIVDANVDNDDTLAVLNVKSPQEIFYISGRASVFYALRSNPFVTAMIAIPKDDAKLNQLVCRPITDLKEKMSILLLRLEAHKLSVRENEFVNYLRKQLDGSSWK